MLGLGSTPERGRPKDWSGSNWNSAKREFASAFKRNELPVLVATKAYGMGIDKPNVRYIVHAGVPGSIEAYYQEAGRAGRDCQRAHCVIVHDPLDRAFWDWAHTNSYAGVDRDLQGVRDALKVIGDIGESRPVYIPRSIDENEAQAQERAIHRLKLLGVVRDYLVDWGSARFEVMVADTDEGRVDQSFLQYVRRTQPARVKAFERDLSPESHANLKERVVADARRLVTFIYETVVNARTRALDEMVKLTEEASDDRAIRQRILDYLALGQVAQDLEQLVDVPTFSFGDRLPFLYEIDTVDDAREWRGATARLLESSPDHPGLLVGRALAEAVVPDGNPGSFIQNLTVGLTNATGPYLVTRDSAVEFLEGDSVGSTSGRSVGHRSVSWSPNGSRAPPTSTILRAWKPSCWQTHAVDTRANWRLSRETHCPPCKHPRVGRNSRKGAQRMTEPSSVSLDEVRERFLEAEARLGDAAKAIQAIEDAATRVEAARESLTSAGEEIRGLAGQFSEVAASLGANAEELRRGVDASPSGTRRPYAGRSRSWTQPSRPSNPLSGKV